MGPVNGAFLTLPRLPGARRTARNVRIVSLLGALGAAWVLCTTLAACAQGHDVKPAREAAAAPAPLRHAEPASTASPAAPTGVTVAEPDPPADPLAALFALGGSHSTSLGSPTHGRLEGGVHLPNKPGVILRNERSPNPGGGFGTVELVQALVRAAERVAAEHPGAELVVNDIALEHGGEIEHHGSHESGRDVDVLFYYRHAKGGAVFPAKGIPVEPDGTGYDYGDLADPKDDVKVRIDLARSWAFVAALIEDGHVELQRIFLVEHVRDMLLKEAEKRKAKPSTIARFADLTCQPSTPHDDHFHIRVYCTPEDIAAGCEDSQPIYPWHREKLSALGTAPVIAKPAPRAPRTAAAPKDDTVSPMEAAAKAGRVHARVTAFLARRDAWMKQPHPGRLYCK